MKRSSTNEHRAGGEWISRQCAHRTIVTSPQFLNTRMAGATSRASFDAHVQNSSETTIRNSRELRGQMGQNGSSNVLRGVGVTMCLPWLDSLSTFAATPPAEARGARRCPSSFAVLHGQRRQRNHLGRRRIGRGDDAQSEPVAARAVEEEKINVINGLFSKNSTGQGIHPAQTGSLLTGAPLKRGPVIHSGISVDQMIASRVGHETLQPSIVLACEQPMTGYHETNFSMAYSSHISWQNADSPVPNEVYPALAFDTLFENRGSLRNLSILDRVRDEAQRMTRRISATDQQKLDEYMTSMREVETRIEGMRKAQDQAEDLAKLKNRPALSMERPANGLPEDFREHTRLMCDIIALARSTRRASARSCSRAICRRSTIRFSM